MNPRRYFRLGFVATLAAALILPVAASADGGAPRTRTVQIRATGDGPASERLLLGLNKAAIVQLPSDAADVLVSNPTIVDAVVRTPRRIYILGTGLGQTNAFFFDRAGKQILNLEIRVEHDVTDLGDQIADVTGESDIKPSSVGGAIMLGGTATSGRDSTYAQSAAEALVGDPEKVSNAIGVTGREQVMLRVRVAEMQRTMAKQLGVDLSAIGKWGGDQASFAFQQLNPFSIVGRALAENNYIQVGSINNGDDVEGVIKAFERAGILRTLAEPNLTAISGESANFLAGGEFPVPAARDRDGNVTIVFKPFGVGLGFTPVVLDEGRISLRISTEVSELSSEGSFVAEGGQFIDENNQLIVIPGVTIPALRVRRAETTVELPSGGSMVMAGLLQESMKQNLDGFPGLKDVPVLGSLFRSRDFQNSETELVVIVTPYLVKPTSERNLALPTDGFANPSDLETIFLGHLNLVYGDGKNAPPKGHLSSQVGFIVE
ncbi:MAG: type II and III secretion system protein family protein [Alphaproteobacteria bacterium]|nr:type II and III secretion system protein family protein [Alphaproteobacteria bacterium]